MWESIPCLLLWNVDYFDRSAVAVTFVFLHELIKKTKNYSTFIHGQLHQRRHRPDCSEDSKKKQCRPLLLSDKDQKLLSSGWNFPNCLFLGCGNLESEIEYRDFMVAPTQLCIENLTLI